MKLFQPKSIRVLFICIFRACFCKSTWNCWIFQIYFFQNFSQVRACSLEPKMKRKFFNQNRFEFGSVAFSGPAVAIEHKIGGFSKYIFFRTFRRSVQGRACGLEPKNEETFSIKIDSNSVFLHFQGLLLLLNIKLVDFQNTFFSDFSQVLACSLEPKMKRKFFNQNRFEFGSVAFSGPAVAIEHKIGGFSKYIFFRFFTGPRLRPWAKKWK